jgi:hypothetical protein
MLVLWLLACQDYTITDQRGNDRYNPPELEAEIQTDIIQQVAVPSVDVLWVIDNSNSMLEEQTALAESFGSFIAYFTQSGLDYHVGVTSTDMVDASHQGRLREDMGTTWIDDSFSEQEALSSFSSRVMMGTSGSYTEQGLDAVVAALETHADGHNAGFYREDAALSVVVISDEDDYSTTSVTAFVDWMLGLKVDPELLAFSSIVAPRGNCLTAEEEGERYLQVTEAVGGVSWSICDEDYAGALELLGLTSAGLKREFFLSRIPVTSSLELQVEEPDGTTHSYVAVSDYTYDTSRNSVLFLDEVPEPRAEVIVTYEVRASSSGAPTE